MTRKQITVLIVVLAVIVVLIVAAVIGMMMTTPQRTADKFYRAIEQHDVTTAMSFVSTDIKPYKRENIQYFIEDWSAADTVSFDQTAEASWLERVKQHKGDNGEMIPDTDRNGTRQREIKPAARYWSHMYDARVTVRYDDTQEPVIVVLERDTKKGWSPFGQVFRPWKVVQIKYQPLDDEALDVLNPDTQDDLSNTNASADTTNSGNTNNPTNADIQVFDEDQEVEIDADGNIIVKDKASVKDDDQPTATETE